MSKNGIVSDRGPAGEWSSPRSLEVMRALAVVAALVLPRGAGAAEQIFIPHPDAPKKRVELYVSRPPGKGPAPILVLIHGHQPPPRPGARAAADSGRLDELAAQGYFAVAVSQPGYGGSDGPPDYCGPFTQQAVRAALRHVRSLPGADRDRFGLVGVSRGAMVAAMVAAAEPDLDALVLIVPIIDLGKAYERLKRLEQTVPEVRGIARNIAAEGGVTARAFAARSPIAAADRIHAPTLILSGAADPRTLPDEPHELAARISENGAPARAVVFADHGHAIPIEKRRPIVADFLERRLLHK